MLASVSVLSFLGFCLCIVRQAPLYLMVACAAAVCVANLLKWLLYPGGLSAAQRRARAGCCTGCGYERRGLAADAVCPECGTVPTST